ncbi:unnamed protein product, partial [Leptidea sinapis]
VNISNTWVLPEEGFPVFYRYFRDRISWYEADAYDAVRAYLKELDISSAVWVGLIRSNPDGDFTWTDYRGLGSDGYWSSAPDSRTAPLCAAADPAADYRWEARACGGPSVASFICELPVPQWALGDEGCLVPALPALTILYLPESAAVQLTADCGLAGVRRVQCTGSMKREDLLKELSCVDEYSTPSTVGVTSSTSWRITTDPSLIDQDNNDIMITEDDVLVETKNDTYQETFHPTSTEKFVTVAPLIAINEKSLQWNGDKNSGLDFLHDNNLQDNNIPTIVNNVDFLNNEYADKLEGERLIQHKLMHDEMARLGHLETLFNQPTDHFIPPLVMAKSKFGNDMTALSFEEKLAQQHDDMELMKHSNTIQNTSDLEMGFTTSMPLSTTDNVLINIIHSTASNTDNENVYKKKTFPKKYTSAPTKYEDQFGKSVQILNVKKSVTDKVVKYLLPASSSTASEYVNKTHSEPMYNNDNNEDETSMELTVIIKEPNNVKRDIIGTTISPQIQSSTVEFFNNTKLLYDAINKTVLNSNHTDFNITVRISDSASSTTFSSRYLGIKTEVPKNEDNPRKETAGAIITMQTLLNLDIINKGIHHSSDIDINNNTSIIVNHTTSTLATEKEHNINATEIEINSSSELPFAFDNGTLLNKKDIPDSTLVAMDTIDEHLQIEARNSSIDEEIDDFHSPLLSDASEPIHKPNRSRRPQTHQNRANKFNPLRILG